MSVPTHFFKVILGTSGKESKEEGFTLGAFVMPNSPIDPNLPLTAFSVPLEPLESFSGKLLKEFLHYAIELQFTLLNYFEEKILHFAAALGWINMDSFTDFWTLKDISRSKLGARLYKFVIRPFYQSIGDLQKFAFHPQICVPKVIFRFCKLAYAYVEYNFSTRLIWELSKTLVTVKKSEWR